MPHSATFTDTFVRANENPLSNPPWTAADGGSGGKLTSNKCLANSRDDWFICTTKTLGTSGVIYARWAWGGATGNSAGTDSDDAGPTVCFTSGADGYLANIEPNDASPGPGSNWVLFSVTGGGGTSLASGSTSSALVAGDLIEVQYDFSTNKVSIWLNGAKLGEATDSTFAANTGFGAHMFDNASPSSVGTWSTYDAGTITAGGTKRFQKIVGHRFALIGQGGLAS